MQTALEKVFGGREHMGQYAGVATPTDFGDVRTEYETLRRSAGIFDLSWRSKLELTGSDRARWLNGMITNNIRDLAPGHGVYAFLLNPQGKILADLYAYNLGESIVVETDHSQKEKMVGTFEHYIIMDDVEVVDLDERYAALGVAGPEAQAVLGKAGFTVPELQPLQIADVDWNGHPIKIVRCETESYAEFELWFAPELGPSLWEAIAEAGAKPVGSDALELLRIARGIPLYGVDIRERDLPQETEQLRALNFNKGCYVGQEIVERIRSRGNVHRKFTGFAVEGPVLAPGAKIEAGGKEVGEVTSSAALPVSEGMTIVALGYIRREILALKKDLTASGTRLVPVDLPFGNQLSA
jgi:folate-binding protein YgfZ